MSTRFNKFLLIAIWLLPVALGVFLLLDHARIQSLEEGKEYVVKGGKINWVFQYEAGKMNSRRITNEETGATLNIDGNQFCLKVAIVPEGALDAEQIAYWSFTRHEITPDKCILTGYRKSGRGDFFDYCYEPLNLSLTLAFNGVGTGGFLQRRLCVTSHCDESLAIEQAELGNFKCDAEITSPAGLGVPVFLNETWAISGETPWFQTKAEDRVISLFHSPSAILKNGENWSSDSCIIGGGESSRARENLWSYLETKILPPHFATYYNTWCDYREDNLTPKNTLDTYKSLNDILSKYGAKADYCIVDDHWFQKDTLYFPHPTRFPNNLIEVSNNLGKKCKFGLWLTYSGMMCDLKALAKQGYAPANDYYMCLSQKKYNDDLHARVKELIEGQKVRFFKHDFNYFLCNRTKHGHLYLKENAIEANMRATAELLDYERSLDKDIHQAITTGINLSPWWLKHANILWMGGKDKDYDFTHPVSSRAMAELNKRDSLLYDVLIAKDTYIPLYCLMTHGIIDGLLDTAGPWLNDSQWSDYVMHYLGRGTAMRELYLHPSKLTGKKAEVLARGLNWAKSHDAHMLNARMVLGSPSDGLVYGFQGRSDKDGSIYVSLRNPSFMQATVSLEDLGISTPYYRIVYPYHMVAETATLPTIDLPAESTLIVESLASLKDLAYPTAVNVRSQINAYGTQLQMTVEKPVPGSYAAFIAASKLPSGSITANKIAEDLWQFTPGLPAISPPAPTIENPTHNDAGFTTSITIPDNCEATLLWTIQDREAVPSLKVTPIRNDIKLQPMGAIKLSYPGNKPLPPNWQIATQELPSGSFTIKGRLTASANSALSLRFRSKTQTVNLILGKGKYPSLQTLPCPAGQDTIHKTYTIF